MAIYRCELSHGSRQNNKSAGAKFDYISRQEKYASHSDRCIHYESKLPLGFDSGRQFWRMADDKERANARLFSEFKLSLPLEQKSNIPAQIESVKNFIEKTIPNQPYTFAIHAGKGANPHCHLVFAERCIDDVKRTPENFFKRANKKTPELGGSAKNRELKLESFLLNARENWADSVNESLKKHASTMQKMLGNIPQVDHRSRKERGLEPAAPAHITKAIEDKIKHLELNDDNKENSTADDRRRLEDSKERVRDHAINVRQRHKENFRQAYEFDRNTQIQPGRVRNSLEESVWLFRETLKGTGIEAFHAVEQGSGESFDAIHAQRGRSVQSRKGIEQQSRHSSGQYRRLEQSCKQSLKRANNVTADIKRTRAGARKRVVGRIRYTRTIESICRGIKGICDYTVRACGEFNKRNEQTNRRLSSIGDRRSDKGTVIAIVKKVFKDVKRSIKLKLSPIFELKSPGESPKLPGRTREKTQLEIRLEKIHLPEFKTEVEKEADERREKLKNSFQKPVYQIYKSPSNDNDRGMSM